MKYIIYIRVSRESQVQSGLGLEAQRHMCLTYIQQKGKTQEYIEFSDEGFSGGLELEKRPGLLEAISFLNEGDVLLIAKRDRIGRDTIVNAMIERAVERKKAKLISASGDVSEENDPSSILMRRMVDAFAEYERLIIGARTKCALARKIAKNERCGYIPYGFRLSDDNLHLEKDEYEQNILNLKEEMTQNGLSFREIAFEFNQRGLYNRLKNPWNHMNVYRIGRK